MEATRPNFILSFDVGTKRIAYALIAVGGDGGGEGPRVRAWGVQDIGESLVIAPYGVRQLQTAGDVLRVRMQRACAHIWENICTLCDCQNSTILVLVEDQVVSRSGAGGGYGCVNNKIAQETIASFFDGYHNVAHVRSFDARVRKAYMANMVAGGVVAESSAGKRARELRQKTAEVRASGQGPIDLLKARRRAYGANYRANKQQSVACAEALVQGFPVWEAVLQGFAKPDDPCDALVQAFAAYDLLLQNDLLLL
jgi:hypothetical protein